MGWSNGTDLISNIWELIVPKLKDEDIEDTVIKLIELFEEHDWDCVDEFIEEFPELRSIYTKYYSDCDDCDE